jgi:hypothetical protein
MGVENGLLVSELEERAPKMLFLARISGRRSLLYTRA